METINFYFYFSIALIILKLIINFKDPWNIVFFFYFFFSFGTVLNYKLGNIIYFGINPAYIPQATQIFFVAILSSFVVALFFKNKSFTGVAIHSKVNSIITLNPILIVLNLYAIYQILFILSQGDLNKIEKISLLNPSLHYPYLLLQTFVLAFFHIVKKKTLSYYLLIINLILYFIYCITTGERDFVFPICSIILHLFAIKKQQKRFIFLYTLGLTLLVFGAVAMFFVRDATQGSESLVSGLFNQGSILFINTNVLKFLDTSIEHFNGYSYWNSIINLLPSFIYKTDFNTVNWFKEMYAANSDSGYGFALDAEGFLNFGIIGVAITFSVITFLHRLVFNNLDRQPIFLYYSTFYLSFIMYALRNDSLAFFKGNLYAILFFFFIIFSSKIIENIAHYKSKENL